MTTETTDRGFKIYTTFHDTYGTRVQVQESSSAEEPRVWIFCQPHLHLNVPAPHLNVEQARMVIAGLERFIREASA